MPVTYEIIENDVYRCWPWSVISYISNKKGEEIGHFAKREYAEEFKYCMENGVNYAEHCRKNKLPHAFEADDVDASIRASFQCP